MNIAIGDNKTESRAVLIGIVSRGEGCAILDSPGIYTRITKYLPWIYKHTMLPKDGMCFRLHPRLSTSLSNTSYNSKIHSIFCQKSNQRPKTMQVSHKTQDDKWTKYEDKSNEFVLDYTLQ